MPLLVLCGYPCSGKSSRKQQVLEYLAAHPEPSLRATHVIDDASLGIRRSDYDAAAADEKRARGSLLSEVERHLAPDTLVVLDSMNYIKGLRYQLHCIARTLKTTYCVLYSAVPPRKPAEWNVTRPTEEQYSSKTLADLIFRFEEPDERNRWDAPLYLVRNDVTEPPMAAIAETLFRRHAPKASIATEPKPVAETNFVYELDKMTSQVVAEFVQRQATSEPGEPLRLAGSTRTLRRPPKIVGMSELRKLRRNFLAINSRHRHTATDIEAARNAFIAFLEETLHTR